MKTDLDRKARGFNNQVSNRLEPEAIWRGKSRGFVEGRDRFDDNKGYLRDVKYIDSTL